jgi:hypothetical protein
MSNEVRMLIIFFRCDGINLGTTVFHSLDATTFRHKQMETTRVVEPLRNSICLQWHCGMLSLRAMQGHSVALGLLIPLDLLGC